MIMISSQYLVRKFNYNENQVNHIHHHIDINIDCFYFYFLSDNDLSSQSIPKILNILATESKVMEKR